VEIIAELLFGLVQVIAELVLQIVFEVLAGLGVRGVRKVSRRVRPLPPVAALFVYALLGAAAGAISLMVFPELAIDTPAGRVINLIVGPVIAGLALALLGAWRKRRNQDLIRLDTFGYGYIFALVMAIVRFLWGSH
jgi:hypothetical protein